MPLSPSHQAAVLRFAAVLCLLCLVAGTIAAVAVMLEARRPDPGSELALMALPPLAGLMGIPSLGLLLLRFQWGHRLTRPERIGMMLLSIVPLAPIVILFALG